MPGKYDRICTRGENSAVKKGVFSAPIELTGIMPGFREILRTLRFIFRPEHLHLSFRCAKQSPENRERIRGYAEGEVGICVSLKHRQSFNQITRLQEWGGGINTTSKRNRRTM